MIKREWIEQKRAQIKQQLAEIEQNCSIWWPKSLCLTRATTWALIAGLIVGSAISWWFNASPPRWMNFDDLVATYELGTKDIILAGTYEVVRECRNGMGPVIWRVEALATDGQVALYGPRPQTPSLKRGKHLYSDTISLLQEILPDGWVVRIIVTCPGETPETVVSPPAVVKVR